MKDISTTEAIITAVYITYCTVQQLQHSLHNVSLLNQLQSKLTVIHSTIHPPKKVHFVQIALQTFNPGYGYAITLTLTDRVEHQISYE